MLASVAVLPADRRIASAVRRFPPGCGRPRNAAAQKPPRPLPPSTTKLPLPNPSARAATGTAAPPPRRTIAAAAAASGTVETDCGAGDEGETATEVTVRRVSAVRRYPPGCGRGVAVAVAKPPVLVGEGEVGASKPSALVGEVEAGASNPPADVCIEAKAKACDREAVQCAIDDCEFNCDGGMENEIGSGDAGEQEEGSGKPWVVTPFIPWAQHGRRSQRLKA